MLITTFCFLSFRTLHADQQVQEITKMITDNFSNMETKHKLLSFVKSRWPTIFLLIVVLGYPYPKSLLPNSMLLIWSTKPNPASIYLWLKKVWLS
ncbi:hypothetical protein M758_12G098500 [Ceratodon purpureus]|nr:hypothetical protein M758_12G098500 [Ceratodon purpureus]